MLCCVALNCIVFTVVYQLSVNLWLLARFMLYIVIIIIIIIVIYRERDGWGRSFSQMFVFHLFPSTIFVCIFIFQSSEKTHHTKPIVLLQKNLVTLTFSSTGRRMQHADHLT